MSTSAVPAGAIIDMARARVAPERRLRRVRPVPGCRGGFHFPGIWQHLRLESSIFGQNLHTIIFEVFPSTRISLSPLRSLLNGYQLSKTHCVAWQQRPSLRMFSACGRSQGPSPAAKRTSSAPVPPPPPSLLRSIRCAELAASATPRHRLACAPHLSVLECK